MAYKLNMGAGPGTGVEASPAIIELAGGQRPPQLGHWWSGGTPLRRDVDDYFGSAAGQAAAPLVVNIHLGLVAERSCDTCPARCPRHVHHHLIARAGY